MNSRCGKRSMPLVQNVQEEPLKSKPQPVALVMSSREQRVKSTKTDVQCHAECLRGLIEHHVLRLSSFSVQTLVFDGGRYIQYIVMQKALAKFHDSTYLRFNCMV